MQPELFQRPISDAWLLEPGWAGELAPDEMDVPESATLRAEPPYEGSGGNPLRLDAILDLLLDFLKPVIVIECHVPASYER